MPPKFAFQIRSRNPFPGPRRCFGILSILLSYSTGPNLWGTPSVLHPQLVQPLEIVLHEDYTIAGPLAKDRGSPRQRTRWVITDGVLRGSPSTAEYQASRSDHQGLEPRISFPSTPAEFMARFSVRFLSGRESGIVPFVEFGHHVARIKFRAGGVVLLAESETVIVAESREIGYTPGQWYHLLVELKGEELVVQFADGPTIYARHPSFALPPPGGGKGLGIAGPVHGQVEIDNLSLWTIASNALPSWPCTRANLRQRPRLEINEDSVPASP